MTSQAGIIAHSSRPHPGVSNLFLSDVGTKPILMSYLAGFDLGLLGPLLTKLATLRPLRKSKRLPWLTSTNNCTWHYVMPSDAPLRRRVQGWLLELLLIIGKGARSAWKTWPMLTGAQHGRAVAAAASIPIASRI